MPVFVLVLLGALVAGGAVYAVSQARARPGGPGVAPVVPHDPGLQIGIPGVPGGGIGITPAPIKIPEGSGPGGPTLQDFRGAGAALMATSKRGHPSLWGDSHVGFGSEQLNALTAKAAGRLSWPAANSALFLVQGGSFSLPLLGSIANIRNVVIVRADREIDPRGTGAIEWSARIIAADYACPPAFLGFRGC